jgi:hypothetical protein
MLGPGQHVGPSPRRQIHGRTLPVVVAEAGHHHGQVAAPPKTDQVGAAAAREDQRLVIGGSIDPGAAPAMLEQTMNEPELDIPTIGPVGEGPGRVFSDMSQLTTALAVVNRGPVVGIHQPQVPELRSLIDVGYTRAGEGESGLSQGVPPAALHHPAVDQEPLQVRTEGWVPEKPAPEDLDGVLVLSHGFHPAGMDFGFPGGLGHEGHGALHAERPGAYQRLIEQVFGISVRPRAGTVAAADLGPTAHGRGPRPG